LEKCFPLRQRCLTIRQPSPDLGLKLWLENAIGVYAIVEEEWVTMHCLLFT
jgi:hypothetical protein